MKDRKKPRKPKQPTPPNPLKVDPSRTAGLRRALTVEMRRRFATLKGRILKFVVDEDCFGLTGSPPLPKLLAHAGDPSFNADQTQRQEFRHPGQLFGNEPREDEPIEDLVDNPLNVIASRMTNPRTSIGVTTNPAMSEAQRRYLNVTFGHDWVKTHGFDNRGPLPAKVTNVLHAGMVMMSLPSTLSLKEKLGRLELLILNADVPDGAGHWVTLGDGSNNPGQHVFIGGDGHMRPEGPGSVPVPTSQDKPATPAHEGFIQPQEGQHDAKRGVGTEGSEGAHAEDGGRMEEAAFGIPPERTDSVGPDGGIPSGQATPEIVPSTPEVTLPPAVQAARVAASLEAVNGKLDRYEKLFRESGDHESAKWMGKLREHVNAVGTESALESLGAAVAGKGESIQYGGANPESEHWNPRIENYLDRHGIVPLIGQPADLEAKIIHSQTNVDPFEGRGKKATDFQPAETPYQTKLDESKDLPGLSSTEDIGKIVGHPVTHFTPEVIKALDDKYGKDKWLVKTYGDHAFAGQGIFFPHEIPKIRDDARSDIWAAGEHLAKYGFAVNRDASGTVTGIKHEGGDVYDFHDKLSRVTSSPNVGGQEHDVHEDVDNGRYVKFTKGGHFGQNKDLGEYLDRHDELNRLWPELDYKFHGISTDVHGQPQAVMSMKGIEGVHPEQKEIHAYFEKRGFVPEHEEDKDYKNWSQEMHGEGYGVFAWKDPKTGTVIRDAGRQNLIKTKDGTIVPIDVDLILGDKHAARQAVGEAAARAQSAGVLDPGRTVSSAKGDQGQAIHDARTAAKIDASQPSAGQNPLSFRQVMKDHGIEDLGTGTAGYHRWDHTQEIKEAYNKKILDAAKASGDFIEPNKYERTIGGDAKAWGDKARDAAPHEKDPELPWGGKDFMAQPAFPVLGVTEQERRDGVKIVKGEGRVHVATTKDGQVQIIPHTTWMKNEDLPVVFETDDTRAMAKAVHDAVSQLPAHARSGQVYAPDVVKTGAGYKVVELNASVEYGGSGYLSDNPLIIDSFVAHQTHRDPAHVQFIRKLLTTKEPKIKDAAAPTAAETGMSATGNTSSYAFNENPEHDEKGRFAALSAGASKIGKAAYDKLPEGLQKVLDTAHSVEKSLEGSYRKTQAIARQVARDKGYSDEHVERVGKVLAWADGIARWTGNIPVAHHALQGAAIAAGIAGGPVAAGAFLGAKAAWYVPVASLAYIGWQGMKSGMKAISMIKKAKKAVDEHELTWGPTTHAATTSSNHADLVFQLLASSTDPDATMALLAAALDKCGGDLEAAVRLVRTMPISTTHGVANANPYHDEKGRFTTGDSVSYKGQSGWKVSRLIDKKYVELSHPTEGTMATDVKHVVKEGSESSVKPTKVSPKKAKESSAPTTKAKQLTSKEIKDFSKKYKEWGSNLSNDQGEMLDYYQNRGFDPVNKMLRNNGKVYDKAMANEAIKHINAAIDKCALKESALVHRGTESDFDVSHMKPGTEYGDPGFHSTSLDPKMVKGDYASMFHLTLPAGTKAAVMNANPQLDKRYEAEHELLLAKDSKFRVDKVEKKDGLTHIHATLIGQGGSPVANGLLVFNLKQQDSQNRFLSKNSDLVVYKVGEDPPQEEASQNSVLAEVANAHEFSLQTDSDKITSFRKWLEEQLNEVLTDDSMEDLLKKYADAGFKKGMSRSYDDMKKVAVGPDKMQFYEGGKDAFMRSSFSNPVQVDRVKMLAERSFSDLQGVSDSMCSSIQRTLMDGLVGGDNPRVIARAINENVEDIGQQRAEVIARTECFSGDTLVDGAMVRAAFRRWYVGTMVEIVTRNGSKFTTTPNHPMLTKDGWKSASILQQGDYLVRRCRNENFGAPGNQDVQGLPTTISEIFDSLNAVWVVERVGGSKPDFHGDGMDGEIEILRADGELRIGKFSSISKHLAEDVFSPSGLASSTFCPFCSRLLSVDKAVCLCHSPQSDAIFDETVFDKVALNTQAGSNGADRFTSSVSLDNQVCVDVCSELVSNSSLLPRKQLALRNGSADACLTEDLPDLLLIRPDLFGNFSLSEPGQVELDDVVSVTLRPFAGHVYNLETSYGYYTVSGYYTGNCIRAHAEGQLSTMEAMGVEDVGAQVEWLATDDSRTCPECAALEGKTFSIKDARGMLPRHPQCRCCWLPADVGETTKKSATPVKNVGKGRAVKAVPPIRINEDHEHLPKDLINFSRDVKELP